MCSEGPASHPEVTVKRCTGCGRCVSACPKRLFTLQVSGYRKHALLTAPEKCDLCLLCVEGCPVGALVLSASGDDDVTR
jgi:ferredoxin